MAGGQPDDLAEELLVDLAEDVGRHHVENVGAIGVVEALEDLLQRFVVEGECVREPVGLAAILLGVEVEQAGIVAVVREGEEFLQPAVDAGAVRQFFQSAVSLHTAVFAHAQEDDAVDRHLNGVVQLGL